MSGANLMNPARFVRPLLGIIEGVGLAANLTIVLDAGDSVSYSSGQSWLDRSGNGLDFFLGTDGTAEDSDPTFNGVAGKLTSGEYFSFDGGDAFRYDSANEASMDNLHKNNALFTIMAVVFLTAGDQTICGDDRATVSTVGFDWKIDGSQNFFVEPTALSETTDASVANNTWHMLAITIDEATGAGGGFFYKDGAFDQVGSSDTFSATYSTPSAATASETLEIGAGGNQAKRILDGGRMACFALWEGKVLTKTELDLVWDEVRSRFGI